MRPLALVRPLVWCLFIVALPALGQRPSRSGVGFKIGPQWATQHAAEFNYEPVPGAVAGLYVPLWCGHRLELQPELLLSWQGSAHTLHEGSTQVLSMFYVQLPFSAKIFVSNVLNLQCGVQAGKLLLAQVGKTDVSDQYRPFDLGFNLGVGVDLIRGVDLTLRYYSGMSTVLEDTSGNIFPTNRTYQLTMGYRFKQFTHRRARR